MTATMTPTMLRDSIAARIASREWRPGDRLPTQAALARDYHTSRHVVRVAIELMEIQCLVESRQGSGTYVSGALTDYYVKSRTRYGDNVRKAGPNTRIELLSHEIRRAEPAIVRALSLRRGAPVHDLHILRWGETDPLCIAHHSFSAERHPDLPQQFAAASGISDLIRRLGISDFRRSDTAISARAPTREEADHLSIPHGSAVVVLEGRNVDLNGFPVEVSTSIWPASRIRVHV